jgi:hypothetical protein
MEGTDIGKAAVREFVRGFEIRMSSPNEHAEYLLPEHKHATACNMFFKYLAEIPGWGMDEKTARILTAWQHKDDEITHFVHNTLATQEGIEHFGLLGVADIVDNVKRAVDNLRLEYREKYGKEYV